MDKYDLKKEIELELAQEAREGELDTWIDDNKSTLKDEFIDMHNDEFMDYCIDQFHMFKDD